MDNASLYVRLSNRAGETNVSLAGMADDLRACCAREGFREVGLHVDDGISGAVRDRPAFVAWLDDLTSGRANVALTPHVDRLTREGLNVAAMLLDVVEGKDPQTGKVIRTPVRLLDLKGVDSANGAAFRMMFVVTAEVARAERERIRERNIDRVRRLRTAGRSHGGPVPYGYRAVKDGKPGLAMAIEPREAAAIRWAASQILAGMSVPRACRWLTEHGPKPRRGKYWTDTTLRGVLTSDAVLGRLTVDGVVPRDADGHALAVFEPVIDLDTAQALRALLAPTPGARPTPGRALARLLSGLLVCHECGARLEAQGPQSRRVYRCPTRDRGGVCVKRVGAHAVPIEAHVEREFLRLLGRMPVYEHKAVVSGSSGLAAVEDAIAALTARLATQATADDFAALQRLQAERERLEAEPVNVSTELVDTGRTIATEWERRSVEGRRELLRDAVDALELRPPAPKPGVRGFDGRRLRWVWAS